MLMEALAMVRRGWPNDGAMDRAEPIKSGVTLQNGDWVTKYTDGTVTKTGARSGSPSLAPAGPVGLVMAGNGDSASCANTNEAVVLWGNFIVDISNYDNTQTYAPGNPVTSINGIITLATAATGTGSSYAPGDPIVGYVLNVVAASTGYNPQTAHLTITVA